MRVLHVYSGNLYGGVERLLTTMAQYRGLCPLMEPHFALCYEGRLSRELQSTGVPLYHLGPVRIGQPLTVWRARRALETLLREQKFDIVVCHLVWTQVVLGPAIRNAGLPLAFYLHDTTSGQSWLDRWARLTPPDIALCNSRFIAGVLSQIYPDTTIEWAYLPVAAPEATYSARDRRAVRTELATSAEAVVIIQVGRLEAIKGQGLHLAALSQLPRSLDWVCWQVGAAQRPHEVQYLRELQAEALRFGIAERVRFLGERSDVPRLLAAADIYCQPNTKPEGFGLTFIEALWAQLPVVTTAIGGPAEILDNSCSILVPPNDPEALAAALGSLIKDQPLRIKLGAAGPAQARRVSDPATQLGRLMALLGTVAR